MKKTLLALAAALVGGVVLFLAGFGLSSILEDRKAPPAEAAVTLSPRPNAQTVLPESAQPAAGPIPEERGSQALAPFTAIDLAVLSADVELEVGEDYAVSWDLPGREQITCLQVLGDTLYFETGFDPDWKKLTGDWSVVITVPAEARLQTVKLATAAGDLSFAGFCLTEAELETEAGAITLSGLDCVELELDAVAGDITVTDSRVGDISAENISGSILLSGDFGEADAGAVSGAVTLTGTVSLEAELETVSGPITLAVPGGSLDAATVGKISYNGMDQGKRFHQGLGAPVVELKSVSGDISISR